MLPLALIFSLFAPPGVPAMAPGSFIAQSDQSGDCCFQCGYICGYGTCGQCLSGIGVGGAVARVRPIYDVKVAAVAPAAMPY